MEFIKEFLHKLGNEYLYWTLIGIIALVIIIFLCIVLHVSSKKTKAEKSKEEFKQSSLHALTPEEIDNISNNSANPEEVKEYLTTEVSVSKVKKGAKKSTTKTTNSKKTEVKETAKPKKVEDKKTEVKETAKPKKVEEKKTEIKETAKPKKAEATEATKAKKAENKPTEKTPAKKIEPEKKAESDTKRQYMGKWKISQDQDGFFATLTASNGGVLLKTEKYKSLTGVKNGIDTIKKNIDGGNFAISVDKYGHYHFKLFNSNNRYICVSEDYSSKNKCESGIESVKRFAKTDTIIIEEK